MLGSLALLAGLAFGGLWLWRTLPPTSGLVGTPEPGPEVAPTALPAAVPLGSLAGAVVAILEEPENVRVTPPGFYAAEVSAWRELLVEGGARIVGPGDAAALIVPWGACLGAAQRNLIVRHLSAGGGLVAVGPVGYGGRTCAPTADTLLHSLLGGASQVARLDERGGSRFAVALGETTLAAGVPPGARLEVRPAANQFVFRGGDRDVYYGDFVRVPMAANDERFFDGAIARSLVGVGRSVVFGFALTHAEPGWSRDVARRLAANAALWAAGRPVVQLASWPGAARAGVVVAQDVQTRPENVRNVAAASADRIPVSFFIAGPAAREHEEAVRIAARVGEVGLRPAAGDRAEAGPEDRRARLLNEGREAVGRAAGAPALGFHSGGGVPDARTLAAWRAAGGEYVYGTSDVRTAGPEIVPLGRDSVVLIVRATPDDFHYLTVDGVRDRGELVGRFLADLDLVAEFRGLYVLGTHAHTLGRRDLLPTLVALLDEVAGDSTLWAGTATDVARWWRARASVELTLSADGREVVVRNGGARPLEGAVLIADRAGADRAVVRLPSLGPAEQLTVRLEPAGPAQTAPVEED